MKSRDCWTIAQIRVTPLFRNPPIALIPELHLVPCLVGEVKHYWYQFPENEMVMLEYGQVYHNRKGLAGNWGCPWTRVGWWPVVGSYSNHGSPGYVAMRSSEQRWSVGVLVLDWSGPFGSG